MKYFIFVISFFLLETVIGQNDCPAAGKRMLKEAEAARTAKNYEKAIDKCNAARNCNSALANEADALIVKIFKDIEGEKERAKQETRKAQSMALSAAANVSLYKEGDYTKAFRYSQYAYEMDSNNIEAKVSIYSTLFQSNSVDNKFYIRSLKHNRLHFAKFSEDGRFIISVSNYVIKVWDAKTLKLLGDYGLPNLIYDAKTSPNGKYLFAAGRYVAPIVWDIETGREKYILADTIAYKEYDILGGTFSPDNKYIITSSKWSGTGVWSLETGTLVPYMKPFNEEEETTFMGFCINWGSPEITFDGEYIYTNCAIWNFNNPKQEPYLKFDETATVSFSSQGNYAISITHDDIYIPTTNIWDMHTKNLKYSFKRDTSLVTISTDDKYLVIVNKDGGFKLIETQTGKIIFENKNKFPYYIFFKELNEYDDLFYSFTSSEDGKFLFLSNTQKTYVLSASSGEIFFDLYGSYPSFELISKKYLTTTNDLILVWEGIEKSYKNEMSGKFICLSPEGNEIVTYDRDTIKLWDINNGKLVSNFYDRNIIYNTRIYIHEDGYISTFDTLSQNTNTSFNETNDSAIVAKNEKYYMTYEGGTSINLWDNKLQKLIRTIEITAPVDLYAVPLFSPDEKHIIYFDFNNNHVMIWELGTGSLKFTLNTNMYEGNGYVSPPVIEFSKDSKYLITKSDRWAQIWDFDTGKLLFQMDGIDDFLLSFDNKYIIIGIDEWLDFKHRKYKTIVLPFDINYIISMLYPLQIEFHVFDLKFNL